MSFLFLKFLRIVEGSIKCFKRQINNYLSEIELLFHCTLDGNLKSVRCYKVEFYKLDSGTKTTP